LSARAQHRAPDPKRTDLTDLSFRDVGARLQLRKVSPVELTAAFLARLERLNPLLNAFITVRGGRNR
jgi:aspartyl-tRNA(Asn)/glutamyl-tRNA(Gln) amidotransferase subunit A